MTEPRKGPGADAFTLYHVRTPIFVRVKRPASKTSQAGPTHSGSCSLMWGYTANMSAERIDPGLTIGTVALTVADLDRSIVFYRDALGLVVQAREQRSARIGTGGAGSAPERTLLDLHEIPGAPRPRRTTGLFHFAVLLPSRADLAQAILRLGAADVRIDGASDHGVSEAIYLADPDGNGIEIYRDRLREEWTRDRGGAVRMPTDPLDLEGILREAPPDGPTADPAPAGTRIGQVHLHVANLETAERFYVDVLGFDVVTRYGSEALFVSAGGYHHHVGLNTWAGVDAPPPPEDSAGLRWFELAHTSDEERNHTASRAAAAGVEAKRIGDDYIVRDPARNGIRLTVGSRAPARAGGSSGRR
jgi:catechol 2,3-dioxygenase